MNRNKSLKIIVLVLFLLCALCLYTIVAFLETCGISLATYLLFGIYIAFNKIIVFSLVWGIICTLFFYICSRSVIHLYIDKKIQEFEK